MSWSSIWARFFWECPSLSQISSRRTCSYGTRKQAHREIAGYCPHPITVVYIHTQMSYSLNSLKGVSIGDYIWDYYRGY